MSLVQSHNSGRSLNHRRIIHKSRHVYPSTLISTEPWVYRELFFFFALLFQTFYQVSIGWHTQRLSSLPNRWFPSKLVATKRHVPNLHGFLGRTRTLCGKSMQRQCIHEAHNFQYTWFNGRVCFEPFAAVLFPKFPSLQICPTKSWKTKEVPIQAVRLQGFVNHRPMCSKKPVPI